MTKEERGARLRLFDILNEVERCRGWLEGVSREDFLDDDRLQYAVERALQIVSEASRHLPETFRASKQSVDWRALADFGNLSRHGYNEVQISRIWKVATTDLTPLKTVCELEYARVKHLSDPWPDARDT